MALKFNPFQPNKMVAPGMFTGRIDELNTIERCLYQTSMGSPQHFLIEGERGIGKSSLLFVMSAIASGEVSSINGQSMNFATVSVDLGAVQTQADIVSSIARQFRNIVSKRDVVGEKAKELWSFLRRWEAFGVRHRDEQPLAVEDVRDDLVSAIAKFCKECEGMIDGVVIMIDEADAPPVSANLGEFVKLFSERLSRINCNNVVLGMSGLPTLLPKLRDSHLSSPRIFDVLRLKPLEVGERAVVVERGLAVGKEKSGTETTIDDDALKFLCELSEGYPHFIQQFAYCAFEEDSDNNISLNDVLEGAYKENGALAQLGSKYFDEMYFGKISSSEYRRVLNTMAEFGDNWVVRKTLVEKSGVKETTLNNALNTLKAKEVILADPARQGYYRLPTRSFAAWINAINSVAASSGTDPRGVFEEPDRGSSDPANH